MLFNFGRRGLVTICGATATGKSGLALALARRLGCVIISADSRQVYREFNIGTAKPSVAQQQQVPHYLIDICEPIETMTLADYQLQAQALINSFHLSCQKVEFSESPSQESTDIRSFPLLVGGTGLYIRSVVLGLKIPRVAPDYQLRSQLSTLGQTQLYQLLQQVDPIATQKIHANDNVRTLRALEVFYVTGRPISEQQGENPPHYPILQIGLECSDTSILNRRIQQRTEAMLGLGWEDEVKYLCEKYGFDLPLLNTLGYQEMKQYLAGDISLLEATELTVLHTRQFAKRQRTWFRAVPEIVWFDADNPNLLDEVWQRVEEFIKFM